MTRHPKPLNEKNPLLLKQSSNVSFYDFVTALISTAVGAAEVRSLLSL